ncbi:ABC transporter ATP-binding protein, partial [Christensenellaceae bacterium OttesenSCG-928-M15]|nr:ABC transporter ATP-binding protein [Christensenellaceae bacterium OttesenSCG-928-M15]
MFEAIELTKSYKRHAVLDHVSFSVAPGKCLGVAGHNGSGKSTLLSVAAQMIKPDHGSLLYNGKNILHDRAFLRKNLGYVPQHNSLLDDLTVKETLLFFAKIHGVDQNALLSVNGAAEAMGLTPLLKKRVRTLSGGMQKRLSIVLALMHTPRILLLDEILSSLDRKYRHAFRSYMESYLKNGGSIVYCSHEAEELRTFCDRMLVLRSGKTIFYGDTSEFPSDPRQLDEMLSPLPA